MDRTNVSQGEDDYRCYEEPVCQAEEVRTK